MMNISGYLEGHLLLSICKENHETVMGKGALLVCKHDAHGGMGFVLNQEVDTVFLGEVISQMDGYTDDKSWDEVLRKMEKSCPPIFWGGPLDTNRLFVVHSLDYKLPSTIIFCQEYGITSDCQILKQIFCSENDSRPAQCVFMLGYAGWKAGQLERELQEGLWLVVPAERNLIFTSTKKDLWGETMQMLGIKEADILSAQLQAQ